MDTNDLIDRVAAAMANHAGIAWGDLDDRYTLSISKEMWRGHWLGMAAVAVNVMQHPKNVPDMDFHLGRKQAPDNKPVGYSSAWNSKL